MKQLLLVLLALVFFILIVKNNTIEGIFECSTSNDCKSFPGFPGRRPPTCCKSAPTQKGICDLDLAWAYPVCKGPGYNGRYPNGIK